MSAPTAPGTGPHTPTSTILERLISEAPAGDVTIAWLMNQLRPRSFGIILLLLGVCGMLPLLSPVAGLLLAVPAFQMIRADPGPIFPRRLSQRPVPTDKLAALLARLIPALRWLERFVRPRWPTPFQATKRVIGVVVLLLGLGLFVPIPLSNVPVGLTIILVAFAYLEEDGVLLALSLAAALVLFAVGGVALWGTIEATDWLTA
ncbi:exopolysaccharide biosynthesis protein [Oleomonas cavernae]|uniref:Exopolysaccharide biosynthesis protein n=1 Tax=Oleomonas cavernae TaxID=2320859 RepID=A0A418WDP4_9PROT|nr:exopolysaccharide biosynthesis protein [Oleomonas cavernae]RJF88108.1 exopolysaccharide biosynthesis protein [Oleomonas cavernae]